MTRDRRRAAAVLALGLGIGLGVGTLAAPSGDAAAESIWVEPTSGPAGTTITIKGDLIGCFRTGPGELSDRWGLPKTIGFYWDPGGLYEAEDPTDVRSLQQIGSWSESDESGINISFTIPSGALLGTHRIVAKLEPQCNYMGLDESGAVVQLTEEPSFMGATFCVLENADAECVGAATSGGESSTGPGEGGGGGGSSTGVVILALGGGAAAVVIGTKVFRTRRARPASVEHLPPRCRGIGASLNGALANVETLERLDTQFTNELTARTRTQKKNLIKAAMGSAVQTTMIVAGGASEVVAARRAALAARSGLGVMEHWRPPPQLSPRLRAALHAAEEALARMRRAVDEAAARVRALGSDELRQIAAHPGVVRAKQALAEVEQRGRDAQALVQRLMGVDPASSPRARYERAEGLLKGIGDGNLALLKRVDEIEDQILSDRHELNNLLKFAQAKGAPLDDWMKEYLEIQKQLQSFQTGAAGSTMSPGFAAVVSRKKELEALAENFDLAKAAGLRRHIEDKMVAKKALEQQIKEHSARVTKIMEEHERALVEMQKIDAAEAVVRQWKAQEAAVAAAEKVANEELRAESRRAQQHLYRLQEQERHLKWKLDDVRRAVVDEQELASTAAATAARVPAPSPGVVRQGITIAGEILLGPETQSTEEVGTIIREGQEYLRLLAARQRAVRRTIVTERTRIETLRNALQRCIAESRSTDAAGASAPASQGPAVSR